MTDTETEHVGREVVNLIRAAAPDRSGVRKAVLPGSVAVVTFVLNGRSGSPAGHWLVKPRGQQATILPVALTATWDEVAEQVAEAIETPIEAQRIAMAELREAVAELEGDGTKQTRRDEAIRFCFEVGIGAPPISRATGLHRQRLWQIRNAL